LEQQAVTETLACVETVARERALGQYLRREITREEP
jgi:hypothetical protein